MPIFTRKADEITARSPETKRESLSVRPSCSHEDIQAVHHRRGDCSSRIPLGEPAARWQH